MIFGSRICDRSILCLIPSDPTVQPAISFLTLAKVSYRKADIELAHAFPVPNAQREYHSVIILSIVYY